MQPEPVINGVATETREPIDHKTSRSICDAVGERLQQDLRPQSLTSSDYLERLIEELRKQDARADRI
jgi:hypothetical protein